MAVRVPESHRAPLLDLARMSLDERKQLIEAIRSTPAVIDPSELVSNIGSVAQLSEKVLSNIVWMLVSMYGPSQEVGIEFAREVVEACRDKTWADSISPDDWEPLIPDLQNLLACEEPLGVTAKIVGIRREYGHIFCNARILSDIRPVFGSDPTAAPLAAAVVHTLRITYHTADNHPEFFVALDAIDLHKLRGLIDRAIDKETALKQQVAMTAMKYLEVEES